MAYFAPYVDETGLHIPSYNDLIDRLVSDYKQLFGNDIYLDNDSMDYQQLSILAKYIYDTYLSLQLAYSSRAIQSAVGVGLDALAPLVSVSRIEATKSNVSLTLTGDPGTVVTNGKASDGTNVWLLPSSVVIGDNGAVTVNAQSEQYGAIYSAAGTITTIVTPVFGWRSVTNNTASSPGVSQEPDALLRKRMAEASFVPSVTVLDGLRSALEQVSGVTDVAVYENDTNLEDDNGLPAHSICCVVNGGQDKDIAYQIYLRKTPGCSTYGTTTYTTVTFYGTPIVINWFRPTIKNATVVLTVKQLNGFASDAVDNIKSALVEYVEQLNIGETLYEGAVISSAQSVVQNPTNPEFVVTQASVSNGTAGFNELVSLSESSITVNLV